MGNLFGIRRRAPVITSQDRAILQLKQQRDRIKIYQKKIEIDLLQNKELALDLFQNGMKERAIIVLRRKKQMEEILNRTDKQLETLEGMVSQIEFTQIEVSVVEGLKVGTEALKQLTSLMNVEDIQQMMEDSEEAAEKQKEISAILQRSQVRIDEDDLLKELEQYQKKQDTSQATDKEIDIVQPAQDVITVNDLPEQPVTTPETLIETTDKLIDTEKDLQTSIETKLEELPDVPIDLPSEPKKEVKQKTRQLEPAQ